MICGIETIKKSQAKIIAKLCHVIKNKEDFSLCISGHLGIETFAIQCFDAMNSEKIYVMHPIRSSRTATLTGTNDWCPWNQQQIDDVMIARSSAIVVVGLDQRTKKILKFAKDLGKKIKYYD